MPELILTVDTATTAGSVAVSRGELLLGEIVLQTPANHTDRLLLTIRQLLADLGLTIAEFDALAVVRGPGSFTGLRVGMATVKGLALAIDRPVVAVSSLQALALQAPLPRHPVCALIDARKKEVYAALYHWQGGMPNLLGEEAVLAPEKLLEQLAGEVLFLGNGALVYRTLIVRHLGARAHFLPWPLQLPRASHAACLALSDLRSGRAVPLAQLAPCYIRPSEAELLFSTASEGFIEG
ncbi:MAG: tRNA (adenosine(37)-N6)-threonylcarbamoyltransferase complex dimerization subunit type 1 TsaB [Desulfuromonadales bacterium]|nr:tRNA (adenosine(37)-N6)-threonylcarbamoyltransferase complex dimerization subunit type 1 TsaB [Desulfuromonadales bacterium]